MINAWSLLYEELNGTMDETYPIKKEGKMTTEKKDDDVVVFGDTKDYDCGMDGYDGGDDGFSITGNPNASPDTLNFGVMPGGLGEDHLNLSPGAGNTAWDDNKYYADGYDPYPTCGSVTKPQPDLKSGSTHKYQEDKGIADLKDYVISTYKGHYTNNNSDVQTLDLIHSVGDAESFCRSNAIKYLSRYDKKGSAKNDILKAMHYCLLLYYFSGNTQAPDYTNTRYETF